MLSGFTCILMLAVGQATEAVDLRSFAEIWCMDCHEEPRAKGDFDLEILMERVESGEAPDGLSRMLDRLTRRDMPPPDVERPDEAAYGTAIRQVQQLIQDHARTMTDTPRGTIARRLNRFEYANTLRDLLQVDLDVEDRLPVDEIGDGFDNSGDALSISPLLLEKYFSIAELASLRAFPEPGAIDPEVRTWSGDELAAEGAARLRGGEWRMNSRSTLRTRFTTESGGPYVLRALVRGQQAGPEPVRMAFFLGDERLDTFVVPDGLDVTQVIQIEHDLSPGSHVFGVAFLNDYYNPEAPDPDQRDRNAVLERIEIAGPQVPAFPSPAQIRLVEQFGALRGPLTLKKMVRELAERAWRGPVDSEAVDRLCALGTARDTPWTRVRDAMTAILVHPRYLFRLEPGDAVGNTSVRPLDDWELATRLSYFLWSTMPDDTLRSAAAAGELRTTEGRRRQIERMLADDRIHALGDHFATQWLQIRTLTELRPAESLFPDVDAALLDSMDEETRRFFNEMIADDLPISRLLDADWSWVDSSLAEHYGIPDVEAGGFRKVFLEGEHGSTGILRHASVLLATSNPTRTSPVKRGKWILEALLDDAPPPPPPGIPNLPDTDHLKEGATLRQIMEQHRADPNCSACHLRMDAMGFALEGFDAVGRYRTQQSNGMPIDDLGELPDGTLLQGALGLRDELLAKDSFVRFQRSLLKNLMIYALGRGIDDRDEATLDQLTARLGTDPSLRQMVVEIIESPAFLYRFDSPDAMMEEGGHP
ncbi:MAG: DUF1592 domain-containing protein [Planctomycetota bacterium]|nr:DUF1592 domain-containing protein [Planctomycetota bacterium]